MSLFYELIGILAELCGSLCLSNKSLKRLKINSYNTKIGSVL